MRADLVWQPSLLDGLEVVPGRRHDLGRGAWVDIAPGWCADADGLFARLLAETPWGGPRQVRMYDRVVPEPRLTHRWPLAEAPPELASWVLLHELAHAMTSTEDGGNDGHGARFVGLYLRLLVRHARMSEAELTRSLRDAGIAFDPDARPVFLDG